MNNSEYETNLLSWLVRTKSQNIVIQATTVYKNSACVKFHSKTTTKYIHIHKFIITFHSTLIMLCVSYLKRAYLTHL